MKIEKLNENQIRCTLTHADLAARHLKLSELAYGTEKAKSLFRDMMQQASFDFGFEAENIPLMIEAIPSSSDSIVLIITKVEDPEELDTRFSKFTPIGDTDTVNTETLEKLQGADELLNLLNKVKEAAAGVSVPEEGASAENASFSIRLFSFEDAGRCNPGFQASCSRISRSEYTVQGSREWNVYSGSRTVRSFCRRI